jgi:hypothetical protein
MNVKKIIYTLLVIILINACKLSDNNLFHFDPRNLEDYEITLSEIADEVDYVPLDNSFPLGLVYDKIYFTSNSFYLSEKDIGILAYSNVGKFLWKIVGKGRGPGEFLYNYLFTVDDKTETICDLDLGDVIKVYSQTGRFLRKFSLDEYRFIENISFYNSNLFVLFAPQYKNSDNEWIFCDTLGNVIKKKEGVLPKFTLNWGSSEPIYMFQNQLCYFNIFTNTVFSILPDLKKRPSFVISPGEHRLPRSNLSPEQIMSKKYLFLNKIIETKRFLIIRYNFDRYYLALIDKHNHKSFLINLKTENSNYLNGIENDLDGGQFIIPENYFIDKGREYMVGLIAPYQIKAVVASNGFRNSVPRFPEKKKEFGKMANCLKETDNPVLMIVRLKK